MFDIIGKGQKYMIGQRKRIREIRQTGTRRRLIAFVSAFVLLFSVVSSAFAQNDEGIYSVSVTVPAFRPEETPAPEGAAEPEEEQEEKPEEPAETENAEADPEEKETEEEAVPESTPAIVWEAGSLTAEAEGCSIQMDYPAEACIPGDAVLKLEEAKGADLYAALKSAVKLVRDDEDEIWSHQVAEEGNRFWVVTLTDPDGNAIVPETGVTLLCSGMEQPDGTLCVLAGENARVLETEEDQLTVAEYRLEPFGYIIPEKVQIGTVTLEYSAADYTVTASYGPEAAFPADTEMNVREIRPGTAEYALYSGMTQEALAEEWSEITLERFFDITFVSEGRELEPQADVDVQILFKDVIELTDDHDVHAVHIENNEAKVIASETDSNEDAAKGNSEAIDTVSFTSDSFSVFGVVQRKKISQKVLAADGNTYEINVTYGPEAGIPENAELLVEEIPQGSDLWEAYRKQTAAALGADDVRLPGLYDISILVDGQKIEPLTPVNVSIRLANAESGEELHVVHFTEELPEELVTSAEKQTEVQSLAAEERISSEKITDAVVEGDTVTFDTDGFSVYAFAYTVVVYYRTASGDNYRITLDYGPDSGIPAGAELHVEELLPGDERYAEHLAKALRRVAGTEDGEEAEELVIPEDQYARFFDIEIRADGQKIEPEGSVSVTFELADAPEDRQDELKVLHFTGEQIDIIDAEISADAGILFEADAFSVYGVITYASAQPQGLDDLNGRSFTISHNGYMTSNEAEGRPNYFTKTQNAGEAAVWVFESTGEDGQYNIYTIKNGQKQYLNINRRDASLGHALLSDSPQPFTVTKNSNGTYNLMTVSTNTAALTTYYLNDRYGNGFKGYHVNSPGSDEQMTLTFQDAPTLQNGRSYMTLVKYDGKYYIVNNDASLTEVEYDPVQKIVKVDNPMLWTVEGNGSNRHIYFRTEAVGYDWSQQPTDYYRRYLNANENGAVTEENSSNVGLDNPNDPHYITSHLDSQTAMSYDGNHLHSGNNYMGVVVENGVPVRLTGNQTSGNAAEILFADATEVASVSAGNHTVDHIDISISSASKVNVPLAYGTYYYQDPDTGEWQEYVVDTNTSLALSEKVVIDSEDMKHASIKAYDKNHNELDNAFVVTGYSSNAEYGESSVQVRVQGSFKVSNGVNPYWGEDANSDRVKASRLENPITYVISAVKNLDFNMVDPTRGQLYEKVGDSYVPLKVNVDVDMTASFNYFDPENECPPLQTSWSWDNYWLWRSGGIVGGSGMDFALGGDGNEDNPNVVALEFTKMIVDEQGAYIHPAEKIVNSIGVYGNLGKNTDPQAANSVSGVNVGSYTGDTSDYSGYRLLHSKDVSVGTSGTGLVYDYAVSPGMYYIAEDQDKITDSFTDTDGNVWNYKETYITTEYVNRGDAYSGSHQMHYSDTYTKESGTYVSVPEVLGPFTNMANEADKSTFLEFYVYNVYTMEDTSLKVKKEWSDDAENYEGDSITLRLVRYKKDAPLPQDGTLNITHVAEGLDALPEGFTATYSYEGPESAYGVAAGSYTVPPGDYIVKVTVTKEAPPTGYTYVGTTGQISVHVPENGSATAEFKSTYAENVVNGKINLIHNITGTGSNTVPDGFGYTATNTATGDSITLVPGENVVPLGTYRITVSDNNVSHPSGYDYNGTTVSDSQVTISRDNPTREVTVTSNYSVPAPTYKLTIRTTHWSDPEQLRIERYYTAGEVVTITFNGGHQYYNPYSSSQHIIVNNSDWGSIVQFHSYQITMSSNTEVVITGTGYSNAGNTVLGDKMTVSPWGNDSGSTQVLQVIRKARMRASAGMTSGGTRAASNIPEGYGIDALGYVTFTLNRGDDWTTTLENLPVLDDHGEPYYYGIEEVSVPGYATSYTPASPVIATQTEDIVLKVTNTLIKEYVTNHTKVTVNKTDGTDLLPGAVFELYRETADGTEEPGEAQGNDETGENEEADGIEVIQTYETGDASSFEIRTEDEALAALLPAVGESVTLKLRETSAPEGYKPVETIWDVVITATQTSGWNSDHSAWTTWTQYNISIDEQNTLTVPNQPIMTITVTKLVTDQGVPSELMNGKQIRVGLFMGEEAPEADAEPIEMAEMTVNGNTTSELLFEDLEPGTYWVYELDENGRLMKDGTPFIVHNDTNGADDVFSVWYQEPSATLENPGDEKTVILTNNREGTGSLTVTKMLAGDGAEMTDVFSFTVTQTNSPKISGDYGDMHFENGTASFTLGHEQSMTATGLPYGFEYTVTEAEANQNDYLTVIESESNLTTETEGEDGKILITDEADAFIKTDETETVTVTNTRMLKKSLRVTKEWMGIPYAETVNYPSVFFDLWQTTTYGWGQAHRYTDYSNIELNYENHWTWECPIELPEEDDNGREYRYFVVETPVQPQGEHGTGEWVLTEPAYDDFVIKIDGYKYREVKDVGRWSGPDPEPYQQPRRAAVPSHGEIKILNKVPGYMQMELKKKFLEYRSDGNGATSLYTTTGESETMRNMIIELQIMRKAIDFSSGQDVFVSDDWEEYGVPFKVGYDAAGNVYIDNDNPFKVEDAGGNWAFRVPDGNLAHGLPKYGLYKRGENDIIVVRYRYIFKETQVYDGNLNPIGGQWVAWLPYAKDANGREYEVSPLQTAQDHDRMLNAPGTSLNVEKEWIGSSRNIDEVYVTVSRREAGTNGGYEDYLAVLRQEMALGALSQDHLGSNSHTVLTQVNGGINVLKLNQENGWQAIIDKVQIFPNGNNQKQYEYRIDEIGYKDKAGNTYFSADEVASYDPVYSKLGENTGGWVPQTTGLPLTVNGPNKLKVSNTAPYGDLEIIKQVPEASEEAAENITFTFAVSLTLPDGITLTEADLTMEDGTISGFSADGQTVTFTLTRQGTGTTVIDGIPFGTTYTVTEDENAMPDGWEKDGEEQYSDDPGREVARTDETTDTVTVTNKEVKSVTVEKIWKLNGEETEWPEGIASITAGLYQSVNDGDPQPVMDGETARTLTFDQETDDDGRTFSGLPVYDDDGNSIAYTIKELCVTTAEDPAQTFNVEEGTLTVTGTYAGTWTVTESEPVDGLVTVTNEQVKTEIHILKVDNEPGPDETLTSLTGAKFKLRKKNAEGQYADVVGYENIEVDEEGKADINDLEDGEYRLLETKAPPGYLPLTTPISFSVTSGTVTFEDTDYVTYSAEEQTFTVKNKAGLPLPITGGSGTLVYYIAGLGLILLAAGLLMIRKRKIYH